MIKINPISFCGKLIRTTETRSRINKETGERERYKHTYSRDEFIKTYEDEIKRIKEKKEYAIKVDDLMQNDPDIQKAIEELPDTTTIQYFANCRNAEDEIQDKILVLAEDANDDSGVPVNLTYLYFNANINTDKQQIMNFLKNVKAEVE